MVSLHKKILAAFTVLMVLSCKEKKVEQTATASKANAAQQAVIVDVIVAGEKAMSNTIEANGSVIAAESADIHPEISGRLTYLNVPDGASVKTGQILAKVNDADLQAALSKTKVQLDLAQKTEERLRKLISLNGINQADYDAVLNQVNSFKADMVVTQAQLDKTIVKAPFSGVLGLRQISPGAYVTPQTILTTLQVLDRVKIDFTIPELYGYLIQKGRTIQVITNANEKRQATIVATEPEINTATRNIKVRAILNGAAIHPGTFVKVLLDAGTKGNSILVPTNAIIPDARYKQLVLVKGGKGKFVVVETGLRTAGSVEITKGISVGDSVVVSGVLFVRPNAPVKVRSVKKLEEVTQ